MPRASELLELARRTTASQGLVETGRKTLRYARTRAAVEAAVVAFDRAARRATTIPAALDLVYSFDVAGVRISPFQFRAEIEQLLELLASRRPRALLEIGTCTGGSLFLFTRVAAPDATIVTVDLPHGSFGGGYPPAHERLFRRFAREQQRLQLVRGDSHEQATVDRVRSLFGEQKVDFLFVDGDHSYEGVRTDFERYSPLVAADGLVGFHDIVEGSEDHVGGVPRFWRELKDGRSVREVVADPEQGSAGIGLIEAAETARASS